MTPGYVHLHLHSEFSLSDGLIRVAPGKKKGELQDYQQPLTERATENWGWARWR